MNEENENPVTNGLVALVAVALVVGLLGGILALIGTRLVGLSAGGGGGGDGVAVGDTLYMPDPVKTELDSRLQFTLQPTATETSQATETEEPTQTRTNSEARLTLSVATYEIGVGENLAMSGIYSNGEGSILEVWYNVEGEGWKKFPATTNVTSSLFTVDVVTYKSGDIQWRVQDPDNGMKSNEVTVKHTDEVDYEADDADEGDDD